MIFRIILTFVIISAITQSSFSQNENLSVVLGISSSYLSTSVPFITQKVAEPGFNLGVRRVFGLKNKDFKFYSAVLFRVERYSFSSQDRNFSQPIISKYYANGLLILKAGLIVGTQINLRKNKPRSCYFIAEAEVGIIIQNWMKINAITTPFNKPDEKTIQEKHENSFRLEGVNNLYSRLNLGFGKDIKINESTIFIEVQGSIGLNKYPYPVYNDPELKELSMNPLGLNLMVGYRF